MSTPKEKAKEFVLKYLRIHNNTDWFHKELAKQCALIAVEELIEEEDNYNNGSFYPSEYWKEVKQEIEKL